MTLALYMQQQVLNAAQAALLGNTDAGEGVDVDRVDPLKPAQLPRIVIGEGENGETVQPATIGGRQQTSLEERTLEVVIDCAVKNSDTAAADARALGLAVEKIIRADAGLRTLCKLGRRIVNSRLVIAGEGSDLFAVRRQTWAFSYLVNAASPDASA